ncbi:hypothetical protein ANN_11013 [Periplaneta americana]|uniref:Uncharacterized protein n=1 Tax=Periplaneta americana TaxID=6978 RepID=A0ABQ8T3U1_PERAM|nr:hypothetical protein ANN_11013 [Periplaneta americana]
MAGLCEGDNEPMGSLKLSICPCNKEEVLKKIPKPVEVVDQQVESCLMAFLQEHRFGNSSTGGSMMRKKRRLNVEAGKSVVTAFTSNNKGSIDDEKPQYRRGLTAYSESHRSGGINDVTLQRNKEQNCWKDRC